MRQQQQQLQTHRRIRNVAAVTATGGDSDGRSCTTRKWLFILGSIAVALFICFQILLVVYVLPTQVWPLPQLPPLPQLEEKEQQQRGERIRKRKTQEALSSPSSSSPSTTTVKREVKASSPLLASSVKLSDENQQQIWPDTILISLFNQIRIDETSGAPTSSSNHMVIGNFITPTTTTTGNSAGSSTKENHNPNNYRDHKKDYIQNLLDTQNDIALLTHLDTNHFPNLLVQQAYWGCDGPIEVAVYLNSIEAIQKFGQFVRTNNSTSTTSTTPANRNNKKQQQQEQQQQHHHHPRTTYHILLEKQSPNLQFDQYRMEYPHNFLRNIVLEYSRYDYFVALDVDFIPTYNSYQGLRNLIFGGSSEEIQSLLHRQSIFVLPSFHIDPIDGEEFAKPSQLPKTRSELLDRYESGTVQDYSKRKLSHEATKYGQWSLTSMSSNSTKPYYEIRPQQYFEPYVLGYKRGIPEYWDEFRGFGFNKVSDLASHVFLATHDVSSSRS